jgi:hypothetical protein
MKLDLVQKTRFKRFLEFEKNVIEPELKGSNSGRT